MAEGITGWRLHVGVIFPTPVPPRAVREWYEAVPEGIDMTTVSLSIQQLTDDDMDEAIKGIERAAKQLANFDVDVIFQSGVPPVVARGTRALATSCRIASRRPPACRRSPTCRRDRRHAQSRPEDGRDGHTVPTVHQRSAGAVSCAEQITVTHNKALGIERNTEIRRLPIPVEYTVAHKAFSKPPRNPTVSTFPAAAGAACTISSCWRRISTPP